MIKIISLVIVMFIFCAGATPPKTLSLVNLVFRHGDRAPMAAYPTDPHQEDAWPTGFGQLSTIGTNQHYKLGQFLRKRYDGFLNSKYYPWEIYVNSSDVDRCLMSAQANLAAMYPPKGDQVWNASIPWMPLPVHTTPVKSDALLNMGVDCPKYDRLWQKALKSPTVKEEEERNKDFYALVAKNAGVAKENISIIWRIADTVHCERSHNMSLPSWINDETFSKLRRLADFEFVLMFNSTAMTRLKGGPLVKRMLTNIEDRVSGQLDARRKLFMYSGHDTTVAAFLAALKVFNGLQPPYASCALLELHNMGSAAAPEWRVQLLFKNDSGDPRPLLIPGCPATMCPLDVLKGAVKDAVPVDWTAECQAGSWFAKQAGDYQVPIIVLLVMVFILLLLITVYVCLNNRRPKRTGPPEDYAKLLEEHT